MHLQRNHYEVLGLPKAATTDEIKRKYRELARKFHPDLVEDKALGQRIFTQINQAYRTLSDPERRSQYDAILNSASPARTPAAQRAPVQSTVIPQSGMHNTQKKAPVRPKAEIDQMLRDADSAMMQGHASRAQSLCEAIIKVESGSAQAYAILGDALAHLQKTEEAIEAYRKSLNIAHTSIVQAKLGRLQSSLRVDPPTPPAESVKVAVRPNGTAAPEPQPAGRGLIGRLLGRK